MNDCSFLFRKCRLAFGHHYTTFFCALSTECNTKFVYKKNSPQRSKQTQNIRPTPQRRSWTLQMVSGTNLTNISAQCDISVCRNAQCCFKLYAAYTGAFVMQMLCGSLGLLAISGQWIYKQHLRKCVSFVNTPFSRQTNLLSGVSSHLPTVSELNWTRLLQGG